MRAAPRAEAFPWWVVAGAGIAVSAAALVFFLGFDEPFALRGDNKHVHFPMKLEAWRQWSAGHVPLWSTGLWLGFGLLGDATTGVWYWPHAPAFLATSAPHLRAFDVATAMHLGGLAAGSVVLLRRLGCGAAACAFATVTLPLASQLLGWTAYLPGFSALCWWPWTLAAADRLLDDDARAWHAGAAAVPIGMQVWAGYPELGLHNAALAAAWILLARAPRALPRRIATVAWLALGSLLLAGPQLLPTLYASAESLRGTALEARGLITVQGSWTALFDPRPEGMRLAVLDPFLGAATLGLAACAVALRAHRSLVLAGAAALAGIAALGDAGPVYPLLSKLPVLELFRGPHKFFLTTQLCVLWLAALGLDALVGRTSLRRWTAAAAAALAALSFAERVASFALHLPRESGAHIRDELEVSEAMALLGPVAAALESRGSAETPPPRIYLERLLRGIGSFPMVLGLETARGGGVALLPASHAWMHGARLSRGTRAELGVDLVLRPGACGERGARLALLDDPERCLRRVATARPRYELVAGLRRAADEQEMEDAMRGRHGRAPEIRVLAPASVALPRGDGPPGSLRVASRRPARVELEVEAPGDRLLLVRESWSAGWRARVDGAPAATHRAGGVFWVARVPAGRHTITLDYSPPGWLAGWALFAGWLATLAFLYARKGHAPA